MDKYMLQLSELYMHYMYMLYAVRNTYECTFSPGTWRLFGEIKLTTYNIPFSHVPTL